jgi:hypothetical protein
MRFNAVSVRSGRYSKSCMAVVDKGLRPEPAASQGGGEMAPMLTAEDVVRRIAAECAYVDDRGGVGIRLKPAVAIVRQLSARAKSLFVQPIAAPQLR